MNAENIVNKIAKDGAFYFAGNNVEHDQIAGFASYVLLAAVAEDYVVMSSDEDDKAREASKTAAKFGLNLINKMEEFINDLDG